MSLRELFPTYPLLLRSPPKSEIKFGTRRLYVDLPWPAYYFLQLAMEKAMKDGLTKEEVKEKWNKFLQDNRNSLTFRGKPFIFISLRSTSLSKKDFLRLDVRWRLFTEYLEEKALHFLSKIEENGENIMSVYKEIWNNFFGVTGILKPPKPSYFPTSREKFRKLIKITGDYYQLKDLFDNLEEIIMNIDRSMKNKIPSVQLYTTNLIMDVQHLRAIVDVINIPAAYLLLRNLLENFVKFFIYYEIGKSVNNPNLMLFLMFIYEYEAIKKDFKKPRIYSLKKFMNKFIKKFLKITSNDGFLDIIEKFKELQIPILGVNPQVLKEFSEIYKLDTSLDKLYSACSSVIHNQPPLPFFSLLEIKFFKHFLKKYLISFQMMAEKLIGKKIEIKNVYDVSVLESDKSLKECLKVVRKLQIEYDSEIRSIIKRALMEIKGFWVRPFVLAEVFHLISPSFTQLKKTLFTQEDLKDFVEKIQPISLRIGLRYEIYKTLNEFYKVLTPELEKFKAFSSIKSKEQKNIIIFYILLLYLPEIIENIIKEKIILS